MISKLFPDDEFDFLRNSKDGMFGFLRIKIN